MCPPISKQLINNTCTTEAHAVSNFQDIRRFIKIKETSNQINVFKLPIDLEKRTTVISLLHQIILYHETLDHLNSMYVEL